MNSNRQKLGISLIFFGIVLCSLGTLLSAPLFFCIFGIGLLLITSGFCVYHAWRPVPRRPKRRPDKPKRPLPDKPEKKRRIKKNA